MRALSKGSQRPCTSMLSFQSIHGKAKRRTVNSGLRLGEQKVRSERAVCCQGFTPDQVFEAATVFMVPVYTLLICAPKRSLLFRAMTSHAVPFVMALAYIAAIAVAAADVGSLIHVLKMVLSAFYSGVQVMSAYLSMDWFTNISWLTLLSLDFLMAREIAVDAAERGVFAVHSIILCFMCGPVGLLTHIITKRLVGKTQHA